MKLDINNWALDYSSPVQLKKPSKFGLFITGGPKVPLPASVALPYFYCSWAEIAKGRAKKVSQETGVKILGENPLWKTAFMDCGDPRWAEYLIQTVIKPGVAKGYKGVFCDTFDGMEDCANALGYDDPSPERTRIYAGGSFFVLQIIAAAANPDFGVITNRGFPQCRGDEGIPPIRDLIVGMMIESMWHSKSGPTNNAEREWLLEQISSSVEGTNVTVLTLDYCPNKDTAGKIVSKSQKKGCVPLVVSGSLTPPKIIAYPK